MLLERHFNPSRPINIHELNVEAPQKEDELPFDPERDLTPEDENRMKDIIEREKVGNSAALPVLLQEFILLFPSRREELLSTVGDGFYDTLIDRLVAALREDERDFEIILHLGALIKSLFSPRSPDLQLDDPFWNEVKNFVKREFESSPSFATEADFGEKLKIMFPEEDFISPLWKETVLATLDAAIERNYLHGDYLSYSFLARRKRILFPPEKVGIDARAWQDMKDMLEELRSVPNPLVFYNLACNMKILAAEEVKITEKGLEVIMRKLHTDFQSAILPLPEIRKF